MNTSAHHTNAIFPASLDKLHEMLEFVQQQSMLAQFNENVRSKIELAIEEALVNIIRHGYHGQEMGSVEITCQQIFEPDGMLFILKDQGIAYDPLANAPQVNHEMAVEDKPIGGYGIYLILKIMDKVSYRREGDSNLLSLIKYQH